MSILLWCLSVLLSVIITVLLTGPIQSWLIRILGGIVPRMPRGVKGYWKATYSFEHYGKAFSETQLIELRQFGNHVTGKNLTADENWHKIKGRIHSETYFTGTWANTNDGDIYHGAFQFIIAPNGKTMDGRWIGFNKEHYINDGPWHWECLSRQLNSEIKEKLLKEFADNKQTKLIDTSKTSA